MGGIVALLWNFGPLVLELRRMPLPRTRVDRGKRNAEAASNLFSALACDKDPHLCVMRRLLGCATVVTNPLLCAAMGKGVAMKRFTTEGTNDQEGLGLIPAQRSREEEAPLGLSFEGGGLAGARRFSRRQALGLLGGSLAGISLLSFGLADPAKSHHIFWHPPFRNFDHITLECQSRDPGGPRFLDGRTQDGTVGLAPHTNPPFTGTKWEVVQANPGKWPPNQWWFRCLGNIPGPQWLDGRTQNSSVGLAPSRGEPFTGTKWEVTSYGGDEIALKCLGTVQGNRWLDGRINIGTVGLSPYVNTGSNGGTIWKVRILPK
jgi:hypothetical protein